MSPLVSVVIPAHNDAAFIGQAIRSALAQSYRPIELIVVDDGSIDNTAQIARDFGDPVRVIRQESSGSAVARTCGIEAARGDFIAFLDADDYWLRDKLRLQMRHLEREPGLGAVYCAWREWHWPNPPNPEAVVEAGPTDRGDCVPLDQEASGWLYAKLLLDCIVHTSTVVLRRDVVERVGAFDSRLRKGQDYDYWLRCSRVTQFHKLDRVLSLYRIRQDSITRRVAQLNYGALVVEGAIARWGRVGPDGSRPGMIELAKWRAKLWRDFAAGHLAAGDDRMALTAAARAIRRWPFDAVSGFIVARALARMLKR